MTVEWPPITVVDNGDGSGGVLQVMRVPFGSIHGATLVDVHVDEDVMRAMRLAQEEFIRAVAERLRPRVRHPRRPPPMKTKYRGW